MRRINYSLSRILFGLVLGLVLVLWPDAAVGYIVIVIGVVFLIPGVVALFSYFADKRLPDVPAPRFPVEGIGSLLLGLWLIIMPGFFADVLMFLLGFILVLGGAQQEASLVAARRWMPVPWGYYLVPTLILAVGVIILFQPAGIRQAAFIIIGIGALVYSLTELTHWFLFTRHRPQEPVVPLLSDAKETQIMDDPVVAEKDSPEI